MSDVSGAAGRSGRRWPSPTLLGAGLCYLALSLVLQRGLLAGITDHVYTQDVPGNDCLLYVWTLAWDEHALATDPWHLFDANIFFPHTHTLLYSDHLLALAVLLAPLRLLTANPVLLHNLITVGAPALDALALFALARDLSGSAAGALVAGLLYGFAPVRFHIDRCHVGMLAAWWLPLIVLYARRAVERGSARAAGLTGLLLVLQGASGIYLAVFFAPVFGLLQAWWLRRFPWRTHRRGWSQLGCAEVAALALLLPTALAYHRVQAALGVSRSPVVNALLALRPGLLPKYVPLLSLGLGVGAALVRRTRLAPALRADLPALIVGAAFAFLLALGPAVGLPWGDGHVRGPYAALVALPGFSALRVPGRMVHLVLLCLAPVAAGGVAVLVRGRGAVVRGAIAALFVMTALVEVWQRPFATMAAPPPAVADPVYGWLAAQPDTVVYAELPTNYLLGTTVQQYMTVAHFRRTLMGNMGILPPVFPFMVEKFGRFPAPDVVGDLAALGITHVVVHERGLDAAQRDGLERASAEAGAPLLQVWNEGDTRVFALRVAPGAAVPRLLGSPVDRGAWRVETNRDREGAERAVDRDPGSVWSSFADLERSLARWYDADGFATRWRQFAAEPVWFTVDLGALTNVTGVAMQLGGSDPLVPPALRLEVSEDGREWVEPPAIKVGLPDVRALVTSAATIPMGVMLERPQRSRFVRLVSTPAEWRMADIQVYAVPSP